MEGIPNVVVTGAAAVAVATLLLAYALTARPDAVRQRALANLTRGTSTRGGGAAPTTATPGLRRVAFRLTPKPLLHRLDAWHARAGRPKTWPMERVVVTKMLLAGAGIAVSVLVAGSSPTARSLVVAVILTLSLWMLPDLLLLNTGIKRREAIQRSLPDALDQLTIAVEAGLGFEGALRHVSSHTEGPLAQELARTLQDVQVGVPRRTAYLDLAERTGSPDLRRFMRAIIQAEMHGVSVAGVLQAQAGEMRVTRRQRAEERAMKIPVKVIFPLMACILPALFVVVLGPAVINIAEALGGGLIQGP